MEKTDQVDNDVIASTYEELEDFDSLIASRFMQVNLYFHQTLDLPQQLSISGELSSDVNARSGFHRGNKCSLNVSNTL